MKTALASSLALALAVAATLWMTMGLRAVTAEQGRRLFVEEHQPALPQTRLIDATGQIHALRDWVRVDGRAWVVAFIYTRCQTLCSVLGTQYQRLQADLRRRGLDDRVGLLTISFDPAHDDGPAIAAYARRMGADPAIWRVARVADPADLPALLRFFGVVVVPDGLGEFQHNAALLWVDPTGRLAHIADLGALWTDSIIAAYLTAPPAPAATDPDPALWRASSGLEVASGGNP